MLLTFNQDILGVNANTVLNRILVVLSKEPIGLPFRTRTRNISPKNLTKENKLIYNVCVYVCEVI